MHFEYGNYYHLYNRSNNRELLFRSRDNYYYFLEKFRTYIGPYCAVLASCLMPTHFHFLIRIETEDSLLMSRQIAVLLRSYTRAINKRFSRHGNLFGQNTRAKCVDDERYLLSLINYIHQNPIRAGRVKSLDDWQYSSYLDLAGIRDGDLPDRNIIRRYFRTDDEFISYSEGIVERMQKEYWS